MRSVSFLFVNTKRVSSTLILFEQFMPRCFKKVGELIKDQMENFNEEERDTLSIPVPHTRFQTWHPSKYDIIT